MPSPQDKSTAPATPAAVEPAPMTEVEREVAATQLVDRFTLYSGAAGLIPVPLIDIAAVGGLQVDLVRRLSQIYGVPFAENRGRSIVASIAGSLLPASAATTTTMAIASGLKFIPGLGTLVAVLSMPAFSACATYVIGKVFMKHFAMGGTLIDFDLPNYSEFIKTQKEKFQARRKGAAATPAAQGASDKPAATASH
jgi:uncharacterized protein (DUF697 family)